METDHQIPNKRVHGYEIVKAVTEVRNAESVLEKSHGLALCQVWTHIYDTNGMARNLFVSEIFFERKFRDYMNRCTQISDGLGGFTLKALETYETYFSTNFLKGKLKDKIPAAAVESYCCLAICLKNIKVGQDVDYAIEMLFKLKDNIHPYDFLDSLFVTLKSCLPTFYFSSGAQLGGHQSLVLDVDTFMELEKPFTEQEDDCKHYLAESFNLLALKEEDCKVDVKQQQFGTSNSTNLNHTNTNTNTNDGGNLGVMDVCISVSASVEFEDLKMEISQRFDLVSDDGYKVTYSFKGLTRPLWIELESDQDLKMCITLCRSNKITQLPIQVIPHVRHGFRSKLRHAILEIFPEC